MHPVWNWYRKAKEATKNSYFDDRKRKLTKKEFVSIMEIVMRN